VRVAVSTQQESGVTICIAANCESAKKIVVAADQMVTVGAPLNVEFEPPLSKIETMGLACVALGAGNTLYIAEILKRARTEYQNAQATPVMQIANAVCKMYKRYRDEKVEEQVVLPLVGPDFVSFRDRGGTLPAYLQPQPGIYQQIMVQMNQFNLGVRICSRPRY
jgi:CMP-N-acetylneuraminic acid synthetase